MSLKISDLEALNTVTVGATGFTPKLLVEGSNSGGLAEIYVSAGSGNAFRLNTNFANGNYIDINPYITGVSNGGFSISQNGTPRFVITAGGNVGIGTTEPRQRLDVEAYTSFMSLSSTINSEATTANQQIGGIDFRKHYALAIGASIRLLQAGGVNNYSTSHLAFYTNNGDTAFGTVPPEKMRIASNGNVLINTQTDAGYRLDVNGTNRFQGYLNSNNCFEKVFSQAINFPNGTANLAADVRLGNESFWGYIEVEVNSTYNNQNSAGKLTKVFAVGTNPNNLIYTNESRIVDSMGTIPDNIAIGDFSWDGTNSTYRIPISHIVSSGNVYTVKVRMFTSEDGASRVFNVMTISSNYSLAALTRQYPYYNSRLGVNLVNPTQALDVAGNVQVNNTNGFVWAYGDGNFYNSISNNYDAAEGIRYRSGSWTGNQAAICHSFQTHNGGWQNRLNIVQNGNVLINGATDNGYKFNVNGGQFGTYLKGGDYGTGSNILLLVDAGGNPKYQARGDGRHFFTGNTEVSGTLTASGGFFNSDIRLKEIIDYDYSVSDIKPISYFWKDSRDNKKHVGYSAQEVQKVMPDAVNEGEDGMLSVNYIEVLVAKIAELENRIKQLEK